MNKIDKTKDELLLELKELKQKNIALKVMFEKDITGRNNAEKLMQESEERFRSLYENSTMGLYRTTPDGKIILANPTLVKMLGYSSFEELAARNLEKDGFEPTYERKLFSEQIEKNGEVIGLESAWTCKEGTVIYISESAKAIRDSYGKILHYDGTVENITKRKKDEETLKTRNRDLATLNNLAIKLASIRVEPDLYRIIVTKLKKLTGASLATFGLYDFQTQEINIKHVEYDNNLDEELTKSLGGEKLMEKSFPIGDEIRRVLIQDPVKFQSTLTEVTFGVVPPTIGKLIQKIEGLDRFVGIAYIVDDELYGTSVLSFRTDRPNPPLEILNLFANMVAVYLKRKLAEKAQNESEEKYRYMFANNPQPMWIYDLGTLAFLEINNAVSDLYGYTREEFLSMTIKDIRPKDDIDALVKNVDLTQQTYNHAGEWRHLKKNGEIMIVEIISHSITFKNRKARHVMVNDITERKRVEEEIISQKNKFAQLFNNSPIAIASLDDNDKIAFINEAFSNLFGYYLDEIKEKSINDIIVPNELKEEAKLYSDQTHEGMQINKESYRRSKDGTLVYVQIVGIPVIIKGKTVGTYKMYVDLTQRKISEEELINAKEKAEEMSRLKSNFLTNMSHELRTPLNGIMGYADLLTSQLDEPELIEMTQGIFDSGKRLSETLNFILDLSKAETDTIEVIAKDVEIVPLAINSINSFSNGAAKRNLQLETIIKVENDYAHLDEHLFSRILYNLLDNALKFTKKGKIRVEIGKESIAEKDWLYIKIKDTGIGIAHDKIDLIWDDFRQVSEGLTRSYEGAGLGLTISKKAVELMQGVISVESELGVGSIFTVKFPAVNAIRQKEKQEAVNQHEKETAKTSALPLVLCVEDDFVNRDIVKLFLKNTCLLETAEDGETALQLATEKKYDLFLMDINLGKGMSGMEVVKELLKMPKYAGTPIIAVTAYVTRKDKEEFLKGGGTHYLSKPFQKREILDLVKSVLKNN